MPCLVALIAMAMPRVAVVVLWLFTGWFNGVFATMLWPVLGFFFLPTTLLWYSAVHHWFGGVWSLWPIVGAVVSLSLDLSPARGGRRRARE